MWSYKERSQNSNIKDVDRDGVGLAGSTKRTVKECVEFNYLGCGGSKNMFEDKGLCEFVCQVEPGNYFK